MDSGSRQLTSETTSGAATVALGLAGIAVSAVQGAIEGAARARHARRIYDRNVMKIRAARMRAEIRVAEQEAALLRELAELQARARCR